MVKEPSHHSSRGRNQTFPLSCHEDYFPLLFKVLALRKREWLKIMQNHVRLASFRKTEYRCETREEESAAGDESKAELNVVKELEIYTRSG